MSMRTGTIIALSALVAAGACSTVSAWRTNAIEPAMENTAPAVGTRAIEVVPKYDAVRALRYPDTLDELDFRRDFSKAQRIETLQDFERFATLLRANREYHPEYRKRCLPVWDYGLEFLNENKKPGRLILFSFRCATLQIRDPGEAQGLYRDFEPQRRDFYELFRRLLGPNIYMEDELLHEQRNKEDELDLNDLDRLDRHFDRL